MTPIASIVSPPCSSADPSLNNSFRTVLGHTTLLPQLLEQAWQQLGELADPHGIYTRLPFGIKFE